MASYMPQPDSGNNCCDCPVRTSPCDDCGGGACCNNGACSSTANQQACLDAGGVYQGDGTTCDPNPCTLPPCNGCGFLAFDGSGRTFLRQDATSDNECDAGCADCCNQP